MVRSAHSLCCLILVGIAGHTLAADHQLDTFDRHQLTDVYYSEGVSIGDINNDDVVDVIHGPYWFEGPSYETKHELYAAKAQNRQGYADNFFSWVYDFNGDGWNDVFVVGFPGTPAFVYENPGKGKFDSHWSKHQVFDWVSNESPQFINLVGDDRPELVCTRDGYFGYATTDTDEAFGTWQFHIVSEQVATKRFGHGLGVGDVNGDGRSDILMKDGWFAQPALLEGDPRWSFHKAAFAPAGGAEMYAYDVDGDGDNDVITSLNAHNYGLAWHEQIRDGDEIAFRQHLIMGDKPEDNAYGLIFTELHSVNLADMDGDGLKDIVTGKTYWSHHAQSPMWDAGAVVYWFKLVRGEKGVEWIPYLADDDAGIGRQVIVGDVNGDELPDIVTGGMKGCHVMTHKREAVDDITWRTAQPQLPKSMAAGLSPEEAAANMTVPPGFRVQLAAGEPQVHQPIAFSIDHRGRVWVAEAHTYPIRAPEGEGKDKIIILEDTDGDGTLDSRKLFMDGLNLVSGLEVGFGGVWVGAAPYLLFIPDKDGDDQPDGEPQVLLDGFGYQDTHETLNAFIWGPDGWLYGCHGVFTHSKVGKPGTPDDQRTPLNAGVWRYHPTKHQFEVFAWGSSNPWGVDFNDNGQAFITACVIPHLYHMIQGARYQRQGGQHFNPHVYDDIKTIADHAHYAGSIRDHAWWGQEPQDIPNTTSKAGGGHAHAGAMIYLGDNWPDKHRNQLFFNNIHGNRVNNDLLEREGSGYVGHHGKDILFANDHWFRGINLKYGPDGSVYLIDWYDPNACHRRDPDIWDRTNGRIYKVTYGKTEAPKIDLSKLSDIDLVLLQQHENDWYVRTSRRIMQERGISADARKGLLKGLATDDTPRKLRAMWALHVTGFVRSATVQSLLTSDDEYVRAWTIQLQLEDGKASPELVERLAEMARSDDSPVVRLYLASALQRLPLEQRWQIVEGLVSHEKDADDHNLPLLYWYGIEPLVAAEPERALKLGETAAIPLIKRYVLRRAASDNGLLNNVVAAVTTADNAESQLLMLDEMLNAFEGRVNIPMPSAWTAAYDTLIVSKNEAIRQRADQIAVALGDRRIFPRMRQVLADAKANMKQRTRAMDILVRGRDNDAASAFQSVLAEPKLRGPAIRALASLDDSKTPTTILAQYGRLTDVEKRDAIATLVSRPTYAGTLLDALEDGRVARTDVHAFHIRQLQRFESEELTSRIKEAWGEIRESAKDKIEHILKLKRTLGPAALAKADVNNGRMLFTKTCASCHKLFGEGGKVGPDITGSNRANLDYLLTNIVDPSAVLGKDYRMTILATADGRVISGLTQKETDSALTLRTINDTVVIPKADIEERQLSTQSLMPERLLESLKSEEVRDLVSYLKSPTQVTLRGPRAPIDPKTKRVPNALEGESLKIVGKTAGEARSQGMGNFSKDRWSDVDHLWWTGAKPGDRLDLEVPVEKAGRYSVEIVFTRARDYGIAQLSIDDAPLGGPIDLYNAPDVITTGVLSYSDIELAAGKHKLGIEITGAHPKAAKSYMIGLDYLRLVESTE
ncbi:MAG: VCBS repeat-containing protein [Planctomycetes bacterium]|nr:VCBS repeat-containing protein [Planctomycetota bacterium]